MKANTYFDFLDNDTYCNQIQEISGPYEVSDEITTARLKLAKGNYYKAGVVGRDVLESVLLKGFGAPKPPAGTQSNGIIWRINWLKDRKIINQKFSEEFHTLREIGNKAIHDKDKVNKEMAAKALKTADLTIRYLIEKKIDKNYDHQLNIPSSDNEIALDSIKIAEETEKIIESSKDLDKSMKLQYEKENEKVKEDILKVDTLAQKMDELFYQIAQLDDLPEEKKTEFEVNNEKIEAKLVQNYKIAKATQEKILSEVDWIYKVLQGEGTATDKQSRAINATNAVYKINGPAGSGKSLILLIKCLREIDSQGLKDAESGQSSLLSSASSKKKAILFTYNKSLMNYLQDIIDKLKNNPKTTKELRANIEQLTIINFDKYVWDLAKDYRVYPGSNLSDYAEKFKFMVTELSNKINLPKFDIVAIDEAQDLNISAIQFCYKLKDDKSGSKFYIVFDEAQKIYNGDFTAKAIDSDLNFRGNAINLETNLRNHPNIDKLAKAVLDGEINSIRDITEDYLSDNVRKMSKDEAGKFRIGNDENAAFLFTSNRVKNSFVNTQNRQGIMTLDIKDNMRLSSGYYVGTIYSAKGLEFDNVFIFDFPEGEDKKQLRYVASSRARNQLVFVG
ncbi:DNA/RNA helicase domain-containing protein [Fundicoccus ignavus]|uniref:AAA family ATPase n=1 Tax=Fundicoccus ignavus TaxID=2664442 RepID=A0A844CH75_9LACT|nr:DNA/RNA helicase domain-containing protein [Fundicoccus ignavus]MRJ47065.1 AAA family ATPase [Fundicoccus ignavus]